MKNLAKFVKLAHGFVYSPVEVKEHFEKSGFHLLPANFYSPIPTVEEVRRSWELQGDGCPYLEADLYDHAFMLDFLNDCLTPYADELKTTFEIDGTGEMFSWENPQFGYTDALALYCMLRHFKPKRIIEIGSGYSSAVAFHALRRNGGGHLTMIEPFPSDVLRKQLGSRSSLPSHELIEKRVQDLPVDYFSSLGENDVLFVDSTHTVKMGSDCLFLHLKVIPSVAAGVVVHVHDVFLPGPMPSAWLIENSLYWCEQYLLQAYLLDNPKVKVLFGSQYHLVKNRELLDAFMDGRSASGGGSFWFRRIQS